LTLATDTVLNNGAELRVDAAPDGSCDRIDVQGSLSISQTVLTIQNEALLAPGKRYLIATFPPGMLSGTLTPAFVSASKWMINANTETGELSLTSRGLLIMIQ